MFIQKFIQQFIPVKSVHKTFTLINYFSGPFNRIYPQGSYIPARLMQVQTPQQEQTPRRESLSPLALPYCQVNTTCFLCSVDPIYFIFKLEQTLHTSLVIFLFAETMLHHYGSSSRISNSLNNATVWVDEWQQYYLNASDFVVECLVTYLYMYVMSSFFFHCVFLLLKSLMYTRYMNLSK